MRTKTLRRLFDTTIGRLDGWLSNRGDGFWAVFLLLLGCLIYLPRLGAYPLWDPWEPHYTQVAWEMQERMTWLEPWYRGIDNWWSKPILMLWMLRGSLALLWDPLKEFANHEWAARLPFALTAIAGGLLHFDWVRRLWGRAAGVTAGIILMTAPQYLLVGRQVMADMPFIVAYGASIGYLGVGLFTPRALASERVPSPEASRAARAAAKAGAWLSRQWPFVAFWSLQALAVLAKGFVAPALAVMILAAYWIATFRWRDYSELTEGRRWWRYLAIRGAIAVVIMAGAVGAALLVSSRYESQKELYRALILATALLVVGLGVFHDIPLMRHALHLLKRIRAGWGLALFFALTAPWFIYMTVQHGWPYWNEFIFYHHLGRAAGTIDKPGGTFDYFVRQLSFAVFPWTAFGLIAGWKLFAHSSPLRSIANRRNLYLLLATSIPYLFFSLSGTKFAHYIMPVVPMFATMIAVALVWLGRVQDETPLLEEEPALGLKVAAHEESPQRWWKREGARGDMLVVATIALITFGILAHDLVLDFRYFLRLFIYYYNRETPFDYRPFIELQAIFFPIGAVIASLIVSRSFNRWHRRAFGMGAVVLACYIGWVTMPAMAATYSFKPFYEAYTEMAEPGEPIGQFNDWQQPVRSVIFLFQNRCAHLRTDAQAAAFLKRPGRKFVLVDRNRLADLRRVAREADVNLYVVFDAHPYGRMVSDQPNPEDTRKAADHIFEKVPEDAERIDANFENKIRLVGWKTEPPSVAPGESTRVSFYFRCDSEMRRDWQIFVHGDGPRGGSERIHADHYPVEGLYPTVEWQQGEVVEDTFEINVPPDYPYDYFHLWTGWYIGNERMKLENNPPNDGQNRVRGPRIRVERD